MEPDRGKNNIDKTQSMGKEGRIKVYERAPWRRIAIPISW
jgi:hypothetical protein